MTTRNDGGPAFPDGTTNEWGNGQGGMSLRDYFAAKALGGILADPNVKVGTADLDNSIAELSFQLADAMLRARGVE